MRVPIIKGQTRRGVKVFAYRAAHVVVPVVVVCFVVWTVGAGDVLARLTAAHPGWVLAACFACTLQMVLCSIRWQVTAARLGSRISTGSAISEYYLSSIINSTVPGGIVGDALRAVRARGTGGLERSAHAVLIERLAGQIALGATLLIGLLVSGRPALQASGAIALGGALLLISLALALRGRLPAWLVPALARRFVSAMGESWLGARTAALQVALSAFIVAANLAIFAFSARAVGAGIGFPEVLFAVPLILAAMLIPFSVAGWGYREGAAAAVFPLIGGSAAAGVSASVVFGAVILVASLPGLAVMFRRRRLEAAASPDAGQPRLDPAE
ncbi:MAG: lysylphosphatidylglycerol synthase transmembrane domain-containing protein [Pseudomonadota bacterium]